MDPENCHEPVCEKDDPLLAMRKRSNPRGRFLDEKEPECPLGK